MNRDGGCTSCEGSEMLPVIIIVCIFCGCLTCTYHFANSKIKTTESGILVIGAGVSNTGGTLMSMTVLGGLTLNFGVTLQSAFALPVFNTVGFRLQCLRFSPGLGTWGFTMCIPIAIPIYLFFLKLVTAPPCIKKLLRGFEVTVPKIANTVGHIMMAIFVPITFMACMPHACYENPAGPGQKPLMSMAEYPQIVCGEDENGEWSDDYKAFFALSLCCLICYTLFFLCWVLRATLIAPAASRRDPNFKVWFRFMLYRFRADRYQWGLVIISRSFGISLTPMVTPSNPWCQLVVLTTIITLALVLQCWFQPWRTKALNMVDTLGLTVLQLITVLCFTYAEVPPEVTKQNNNNAAFGIMGLTMLMVGFVAFIVGRIAKNLAKDALAMWRARKTGDALKQRSFIERERTKASERVMGSSSGKGFQKGTTCSFEDKHYSAGFVFELDVHPHLSWDDHVQ